LTPNDHVEAQGHERVKGNALRVGWFWVRANLKRTWTDYLVVVLLVGSIGGLAIGTLTAAKRTQSSFNVFLASTNPSDLTVTLEAPNISADLARLAHVRDVGESSYSVNAFPAGRNGAPGFPVPIQNGSVIGAGSVKGEYFTEDKVAVVAGRLANPKKADEFMVDADVAKLMRWHVGETIPMYFYLDAQTDNPKFGTNKVKPHVSLMMHLVGTIIPNDDVLLDEVDRKPDLMIFTPALTRQLVNNKAHYNDYALQLNGGVRDISLVEREIIAALPKGTTYSFHVNSVVASEVNRSIEPDSIALDVFGLIAALAALIIAASLIARILQSEYEDLETMRALGAGPAMRASASLMGLGVAVVSGALLAVGVAIVLSPLSPIGPVRAVYPDGGFSFDWPILGLGFVFLTMVMLATAIVLVRRRTRRSTLHRGSLSPAAGSKAGRWAADIGLPVTAVVGVRFALESGRDREKVPVRSALVGAVLAVAIVVTTLTFGSSLATLVSHPRLYGWNWTYAFTSGGVGVPPQAAKLLKSDPYVAAYSGDSFANVQINGDTVPLMLSTYHAPVSPPILSGHEVDAADQIVLGTATLKQLNAHVGGYVVVSYGTKKDFPVYVPPTRVKVVGTATLPAIGGVFDLHTSMGVGAILPIDAEPPAMRQFLHSPYEALNGFATELIRLRPGAPPAFALSSLQKIARAGTRDIDATPDEGGDQIGLQSVQYPAEIENYRTIGVVPDLLALALAIGAVVALGLTLVASVHRRRRDLALLRTLGFTSRQLLSAVAWQASVAGAIGSVVGIPVGILLGRWLWTLFARNIYAVPEPTVPATSMVIVAVSALVLANIVAALPGRSAAKTSTARVLRGE
jgi:hypothetical protein